MSTRFIGTGMVAKSYVVAEMKLEQCAAFMKPESNLRDFYERE